MTQRSIPKGLRLSAQGWRASAYLGSSSNKPSTATRLRQFRFGLMGVLHWPQPRWGCDLLPTFPRVARASQPWALGHSPVGADAERDCVRRTCRSGFASGGNLKSLPRVGVLECAAAGLRHSRAPANPKGIASSSPRLRGTSYLGSSSNKASTATRLRQISRRRSFNPKRISRPTRSRVFAATPATRPEN